MTVKNAVADLVRGRRQDLKLGYCIVRNRGADDQSATLDAIARDAREREFFLQPPFNTLEETRVGIPALRSRLRTLLMDRTRTEFPNVKRDMAQKLKEVRQMLDGLGEARSSQTEQLAYLCKIASRFSELAEYGRNAYYPGDPIFTEQGDLRLITRIRELNEKFAAMFFKRAHRIEFQAVEAPSGIQEIASEEPEDVPLEIPSSSSAESDITSLVSETDERGALYSAVSFRIPTVGESDLHDILADPFICEKPFMEPLLEEIERMHHWYRGYELGTVCLVPELACLVFRMLIVFAVWKPRDSSYVQNAGREVEAGHPSSR